MTDIAERLGNLIECEMDAAQCELYATAKAEIERLRALGPDDDWEERGAAAELRAEIERLTGRLADLKIENWQLKGALGYEVPGQIPCGDFKCGLCEAKHNEIERLQRADERWREDYREARAEIERLRGEIESWKALVAKYEGYTDARRALEPKP